MTPLPAATPLPECCTVTHGFIVPPGHSLTDAGLLPTFLSPAPGRPHPEPRLTKTRPIHASLRTLPHSPVSPLLPEAHQSTVTLVFFGSPRKNSHFNTHRLADKLPGQGVFNKTQAYKQDHRFFLLWKSEEANKPFRTFPAESNPQADRGTATCPSRLRPRPAATGGPTAAGRESQNCWGWKGPLQIIQS